MLGDSFVDGYSEKDEARVSAVLEREVNQKGKRRKLEVIPMGTTGYSTDQELLWLESGGWQFSPDVVILMFYANDVVFNATTDALGGVSKPLYSFDKGSLQLTGIPVPLPRKEIVAARTKPLASFAGLRQAVEEHSRFFDLAKRTVKETPWLRAVGRSVGFFSPPQTEYFQTVLASDMWAHTNAWRPEIEHAWQVTQEIFRLVRRSAGRRNVDVIFVYIPHRVEVYPEESEIARVAAGISPGGWEPGELRRRMQRFCDEERALCLDPTGIFAAESRALLKTDRLYYNFDLHWTARGHALAARFLASHLLGRIDQE